MKSKDKLKEEVQFWLSYVIEWERNHNEPIPDRAQLLLENAISKLRSHYHTKNDLVSHANNHSVH